MDSASGRVETDAICASRRSSRTERLDDRVRAKESVYRVRREAREGEVGNVDKVGGPPRRIRFPRMFVSLLPSAN